MEREIKGQSLNLDNLLKKLFHGNLENINSVNHENIKKPIIYNIWMEVSAKINFEEAHNIAFKLHEYNFCNAVDIDSITNDLFRYQKAKIAILPKNYINNFLEDINGLWPKEEVNFIFSEFKE